MKKIGIIGGGVIGMSSAVRIAEYFYDNPNIQVILLSNEMSPNTTGDGSAGLWGPYLSGDTPDEKILKWSGDTHNFLYDLWRNGLASEVGICLLPMIKITTDPKGFPEPFWKDIVFGCQPLKSHELETLRLEHGRNYTGGYHFITFTCEPTRLLPYLFKRFQNVGGQYEKRCVKEFDELFINENNTYDLIVNCTGLDARNLAKDKTVHSIRGQVTRVDAPWMYQVILDESDDGNYIIPNINSVVLGGTHQIEDYNTNVSKEDSEFIMKGCVKIVPGLANAKILNEWVGLRPGRNAVRLEVEPYHTVTGKDIFIIHNYGHGGSGVTLSWGCSTDVLDIVKNLYEQSKKSKCKL